jgi:hypothetical protein
MYFPFKPGSSLPTGEVVARSETPNRKIEPGESLNIERDLTVRNPTALGPRHPYMYQLVTTVREASSDQGHNLS